MKIGVTAPGTRKPDMSSGPRESKINLRSNIHNENWSDGAWMYLIRLEHSVGTGGPDMDSGPREGKINLRSSTTKHNAAGWWCGFLAVAPALGGNHARLSVPYVADCDDYRDYWNQHPISGKGHDQTPADMRLIGEVKYGEYADNFDDIHPDTLDRCGDEEPINVPKHESPFKSEETAQIFSATLADVKAAEIMPRHLGGSPAEWGEDGYPETEMVKMGRKDVEIILPFPSVRMRLLTPPVKRLRLSTICQRGREERTPYYTERIRELCTDSLASLFDILRTIGPDLPGDLFPRLTGVYWHEFSFAAQHVLLFLHTTLTKIDLNFFSRRPDLSILNTLAHKYPMLQDITIQASQAVLALTGVKQGVKRFDPQGFKMLVGYTLGQEVPGLLRPVKITLTRVGWKALQRLSRLDSLISLKLEFLPFFEFPWVRGPSPTFSFPRLRALEISAIPVDDEGTKFFQLCRDVPLVSLIMDLECAATIAERFRLFSALSAGCSHSSLTSLSLGGDQRIGDEDPESCIIPGNTLQLLFVFVDLTSVYNQSPSGFNLDDALISDMARARTRIESLELWSKERVPCRVTLCCFRSFAQHCPLLEYLAMTVDASDASVELATPSQTSQGSLYTIRMMYSPVATPVPVAQFLYNLFPELWVVRTEHDYSNDDEEDEDSVEDIRHHRCWKERHGAHRADGKLIVMTLIDPAFPLIPILQSVYDHRRTGIQGMFPADEIFEDAAANLEQSSTSAADKDVSLLISKEDVFQFGVMRKCTQAGMRRKGLFNTIYYAPESLVPGRLPALIAAADLAQDLSFV
ncbi:hypothetical protein B0H13DRAFT_1852451 [Mycena leptocephala]|nr:hypothetical protein B0H13DRAFT_1852451 [Mycena leptocephala]